MSNAKTKKVLKTVINVIIWVFVAFSVVVTILALAAQNNSIGVPSIGGKAMLTVQSDSMKPVFKEGDLLIADVFSADDTAKQELKVNDIISYHTDLNGDGYPNEINTHRIIEVVTDSEGKVTSYITQGDNREMSVTPDSPVAYKDVLCIWYEGSSAKIPVVGSVLTFLTVNRTGFLLIIVIPLLLFFIYELVLFILTLTKMKNDGKKSISAADEELIKQRAIDEYLRQQAAAAVKADEDKEKEENGKTEETPAEAPSEEKND